ncbi:MAG: SDR family NAD(P)-dependent oxidoreductase, partial [Bacteroidales bacterium]
MHRSLSDLRTVLITGGTSGLGLELVKLYLDKGFEVVATGRNLSGKEADKPHLKLFATDFSDLKQTAGAIRKICDSFNFDIVINNAGVLSPPDLTLTSDGLEYSFQVNFLSHLLVNEIIIRSRADDRPLISVAVTSPVYQVARPDLSFTSSKKTYRPLKAYSESKLLLALMCKHFSELHTGSGMKFIAFN